MRRVFSPPPMPAGAGFRGGLAAGCAFLTVELIARVLNGVPTLPELMQDRLVRALPGPVFSFMLTRLLYLGKPAFFAGLLLLQLLLAGLAGIAIARWRRPVEVAVALWLLTGLALLPWAGREPFGGTMAVAVTTFLSFAAYVVALMVFWHAPWAPADALVPAPWRKSSPIARRAFIGGMVLFVASAALARRAVGRLPRLPQRGRAATPPITPTADFYVVSKNISDPEVDAGSWRLEVQGLVDRPLSLRYDEILAMPSEEIVRTLECISNEVGGDLISNGQWTGVRLAAVLERAGVRPDAGLVHFTSVDGYTENMPLRQAMDPHTFLVYQLNGQPLPLPHGFPLRVLGAGTYGMKNPKWLKRIELVTAAPEGFWEQQGWTNVAVVQTMSRIDAPGAYLIPAGNVDFAGIAFAGDRGIQRVEISTDNGQRWEVAELQPALGPLTWVLWRGAGLFASGRYDVLVRATDGTGQLQTSRDSDPFPDGATGYHKVRMQVER